MYTKKCLEVR